jgi:ATPases involved in chromosome partitioning
LNRPTDKDKLRLVAALDGLEDHFDLVIIDSGAGIGDNVLFFVGRVQEVVLVLSPEPTSLVDAYAVVKVLSLHYIEDLTYREIAGILKVSEPRVCQLHTEAIGQLRKLLPDA